MRAVKAKKFRRAARVASVGMPVRSLLVRNHEKMVRDGEKESRITRLQALNDPKSTRGIYRAMKTGTR